MKASLSPAERSRLVALLNLLESSHEGERGSAGLHAARLLRSKDITWADLLITGNDFPRPIVIEPWQNLVRACLRAPARLSAWEIDFLEGIRFRKSLTPKQRAVLSRIAERGRTS